MKRFLPQLVIIAALICLASCGPKSVGKLEVSQSFATTNSSFGGGLIISGKNLSSGRTFSHSILIGKEIRIMLGFGLWKISAVGWDGGGATGYEKLFAGTPHCGTIIANLISASTIVNLSINEVNCNTADFTAGHIAPDQSLKNFGAIITCNSFFDPSTLNAANSIASNIVGQGANKDGFCEGLMPSDLKSKVKAVKIQAMEKSPGQLDPTPGSVTSGCLQGTTNLESKIYPTNTPNPYSGYTFKLPFANLPLMITTFRDTACTRPEAVYHFVNGLVNGDPKGDHLLHAHNTNSMKILLAGNDLKKAISPFMPIMPFFKRYNSGSPLKFLTGPQSLSYDYHALVGPNKIILQNESICETITPNGDISSPTCTDLGDQVQIAFTGDAEGSGDLAMNGNTYTVYVADFPFTANRYASQKLSMSLIGHSVAEDISAFFGLEDKEENDDGVISVIRSMLSPNGAGGVVGVKDLTKNFTDSCLNLVADKSITLFEFEKMQMETYRVILHNTIVGAPTKFTCNSSNMDEPYCSTNGKGFDKRMLIYDYKISTIRPAMVLEFNCTTMLGKMERNSFKIEGVKKEEVKEVINWNTDPGSNLANQRFEIVRLLRNYEFNTSWKLVDESKNMSRVRKTGTDDYEIWHYNYLFRKNGENYDQSLGYKRLKTQATTSLDFLTASTAVVTNVSPTSILTDTTYDTLLNNTPTSEAPEDRFVPNDAFPQQTTWQASSGVNFSSHSNNFTYANKVNDALDFKLRTLGQSAFWDTFGGSFYVAP